MFIRYQKLNSDGCYMNTFILEYMVNELNMDESKVPKICAQVYKDYGTTMAGLQVRFQVYTVKYVVYFKSSQLIILVCRLLAIILTMMSTIGTKFSYIPLCVSIEALKSDVMNMVIDSYVHGRLPYENLKPDHVLRSLLHSLPLRKVVNFDSFPTNHKISGIFKDLL